MYFVFIFPFFFIFLKFLFTLPNNVTKIEYLEYIFYKIED